MKKKYIITLSIIVLVIIAIFTGLYFIKCNRLGQSVVPTCHIKSSDEGRGCNKSLDCPHTKLCVPILEEEQRPGFKGICFYEGVGAGCVSHLDEKGNSVPQMMMCD